MKLKDVRSYGTEGRRGGVNEVDPQEQEYPVVIFKVDHIKDFKIIKKPDEVVKPKTFVEQDPAIISAQTATKKEEPRQPQPAENSQKQEAQRPRGEMRSERGGREKRT